MAVFPFRRLDAVPFFFNEPAPAEISPLSLHDALPICARRGRGEETSAVASMVSPKPLRYKHFDGLPQQFAALVTEELLGLAVYRRDQTFVPYLDHDIGRCFHNELKALFGFPALGDVDD